VAGSSAPGKTRAQGLRRTGRPFLGQGGAFGPGWRAVGPEGRREGAENSLCFKCRPIPTGLPYYRRSAGATPL
jgi:hypothetical protein